MKKEGNEWKEVSKQLLVKIYFCALGKFIKKKTKVSHDITKKIINDIRTFILISISEKIESFQ